MFSFDAKGLGGNTRIGWADLRAGTAILAQGGIDNVLAVAFRDGTFGAFGFTGAAGNAIGGNFVGHDHHPFIFEPTQARIAQG